ncbi:MAG: TonB C-terminal domain-containing protein, partial [Desulfobacteraceae bacterium]|nr:TonB C-terminal domain-containing protein [Desulfobacteraceae bacterium]
EDLLKSEKKQPKKITTKKPDKRLKKKPIKKLVKKIVKPVKKKEKEFSEKKALEPAKVTKTVKEDIKEKAEDPEQNKIRDLLSDMREKVAEQEMQTDDDYEEEEIQTSGKRVWSKGGHTASAIYHGVLAATIQQNWVFNERLAKLSKLSKNEKKLEVRVVIKIMKNGDLGDIWTETKSGNNFLDKSAVRAIKKAAPFPPLPKEFQRSSYEIGLIFSPKGLK